MVSKYVLLLYVDIWLYDGEIYSLGKISVLENIQGGDNYHIKKCTCKIMFWGIIAKYSPVCSSLVCHASLKEEY